MPPAHAAGHSCSKGHYKHNGVKCLTKAKTKQNIPNDIAIYKVSTSVNFIMGVLNPFSQ